MASTLLRTILIRQKSALIGCSDASRPATARTVDKFEQLVMRRDIEIAGYLDARISEATTRRQDAVDPALAEQAAWEAFALLRQRKGLRLPGGPERGAINILNLEAEQSAGSEPRVTGLKAVESDANTVK
eukprot:scaffold36243_cov32-Prasinocladus_malaysianus.AAC.2